MGRRFCIWEFFEDYGACMRCSVNRLSCAADTTWCIVGAGLVSCPRRQPIPENGARDGAPRTGQPARLKNVQARRPAMAVLPKGLRLLHHCAVLRHEKKSTSFQHVNRICQSTPLSMLNKTPVGSPLQAVPIRRILEYVLKWRSFFLGQTRMGLFHPVGGQVGTGSFEQLGTVGDGFVLPH